MRKWLLTFGLWLVGISSILGAVPKDYFFSLSNCRVRPMGMGGAFTAIAGELQTAFYNPATFNLADLSHGLKLSVFFNPMVSIGLFDLYNKTNKELSVNEWWNVFRVLPKAVVLSTSRLEFGLVNHEELEERVAYHPHVRFFEADHFFQYHAESAVLRMKLATQVQIGGAVQYYTVLIGDSLRHGFGTSYGVFILPNPRVNIGVVFINVPNEMANVRLNADRFEDETVNVGISYHPFSLSTVAIDVRNLTEESQKTTRELHVGLEQGLWQHLFLRLGYYRDRLLKEDHYSAGIGLLNLNLFQRGENHFSVPVLALNYAISVTNTEINPTRWHFFSLTWGF